jgi:uncharacterized membrane protein
MINKVLRISYVIWMTSVLTIWGYLWFNWTNKWQHFNLTVLGGLILLGSIAFTLIWKFSKRGSFRATRGLTLAFIITTIGAALIAANLAWADRLGNLDEVLSYVVAPVLIVSGLAVAYRDEQKYKQENTSTGGEA